MRTKAFLTRKRRVRAKISGSKDFPRISVFRSNKGILAQMIDDETSRTLLSASERDIKEKGSKTEVSFKVGELLASKALKKSIKRGVLDRSGYKFHGRIKALTEGLKKGGLKI